MYDIRNKFIFVYIKNKKIPIFSLYGSIDCQVPSKTNNDLMFDCLSANDVWFSLITLNNKNHLFQNATTGTMKEYANISETIAFDVLTMLKDWILKYK